MTEPDVVAEMDRWLADNGPSYIVQRARDEIEALRGENREMRRTFGSHPLFKEVRAEALEEAAREGDRTGGPIGALIAKRIRALKDKSDG